MERKTFNIVFFCKKTKVTKKGLYRRVLIEAAVEIGFEKLMQGYLRIFSRSRRLFK